MSPLETFLLIAGIWVSVVLIARWVIVPLLRHGPDHNPVKVLLWRSCQVYSWTMHRVRYRGEERLRRKVHPGGLIVVSNHTCSVDPVLVQCGCRFAIRWLMAKDMMISQLDWLWDLQKVIPVSRDGSDSAPVREAIRHVRGGGAIGIFPEGRIVRPRGEIRPFLPGVGAIVSRTKAPVLIVWISGSPQETNMTKAFFTPSRSRVEYVAVMTFDTDDPNEITEQLRERLSKASGWPLNDEPMPPAEDEQPTVTDELSGMRRLAARMLATH